METILRSRTREVVIGSGRPFCIIGERINPTGRKAFQAQLQAGDVSQLEIDIAEQAELMQQAVRLAQSLTDLPLCIDSSVVEALEAGLSAYEGKALVNSVT